MPLQTEDTRIPTGERRLVKYIGEASKTPDQILEEKETTNQLTSAIKQFSDEDQEILETIFDEILRIHHYRDQQQLIKFIERKFSGSISRETILRLFGQISENLRASA